MQMANYIHGCCFLDFSRQIFGVKNTVRKKTFFTRTALATEVLPRQVKYIALTNAGKTPIVSDDKKIPRLSPNCLPYPRLFRHNLQILKHITVSRYSRLQPRIFGRIAKSSIWHITKRKTTNRGDNSNRATRLVTPCNPLSRLRPRLLTSSPAGHKPSSDASSTQLETCRSMTCTLVSDPVQRTWFCSRHIHTNKKCISQYIIMHTKVQPESWTNSPDAYDK